MAQAVVMIAQALVFAELLYLGVDSEFRVDQLADSDRTEDGRSRFGPAVHPLLRG